jgi:ribonuclease G
LTVFINLNFIFMRKEIIIYHRLNDVQVAITEDNSLSELYFDNPEKERSLGNIYLGKISKIVTGINAAFVDIGTEQDAFLHFSDIDSFLEIHENEKKAESTAETTKTEKTKGKKGKKNKKNEEPAKFVNKDVLAEADSNFSPSTEALRTSQAPTNYRQETTFRTKSSGDIKINLQEGQYLLVQINREAYSNKGVRVTTKIGIPGRYIVLFPFSKNLGISKKILNQKERTRLKNIAKSHFPKNLGVIMRTVCESKSEEDIRKDMQEIMQIWNEIKEKVKSNPKPQIVYQDLETANSVVRDHFNSQIDRLVTNSGKLYKEIRQYLSRNSSNLVDKVELYQGEEPIFEFFGIQKDIEKIHQHIIYLKSGGYIIFDKTEALTVVDVNSGRTKEKEQENLSFQTNSESAREIAKQLRLRDIGGIIVIDFIDMSNEAHQRRIFYEMKRELAKDKAKTIVLPITQIGLMQITRQRISQNVEERTNDKCPTCEGTGKIQSKFITFNAIENWIKKFKSNSEETYLELVVNPYLADYITSGEISNLTKLIMKHSIKINLRTSYKVPFDKFSFVSIRQQKDITNQFL